MMKKRALHVGHGDDVGMIWQLLFHETLTAEKVLLDSHQ